MFTKAKEPDKFTKAKEPDEFNKVKEPEEFTKGVELDKVNKAEEQATMHGELPDNIVFGPDICEPSPQTIKDSRPPSPTIWSTRQLQGRRGR